VRAARENGGVSSEAPFASESTDGRRTILQALTEAYASILKRQRTASSAFVRWSSGNRRAPAFVWLPAGRETLMMTGRPRLIRAGQLGFDVVKRMHDTTEL